MTKIDTLLPGLWKGSSLSLSFSVPFNQAYFLTCRSLCGLNIITLILCCRTCMAGYILCTFRTYLKLGEICTWDLTSFFFSLIWKVSFSLPLQRPRAVMMPDTHSFSYTMRRARLHGVMFFGMSMFKNRGYHNPQEELPVVELGHGKKLLGKIIWVEHTM